MSGWLINVDLPFDRVGPLLVTMAGASQTETGARVVLEWDDDTSLSADDASPDEGTDISVHDLTERRGWTVFEFLVEHTTAKIWMMDGGGLLLSGRGITPDEVGLELATDRVPGGVIHRDEAGEVSEWSPLKNPRDGALIEEPED